jgi:hypothetical protein
MLAHHPVTGKPIRVMKTRGQIWRDAKTLVLLKADADPKVPWARWETVAVGRDTVDSLVRREIEINIPIFIDEPGITADELHEYAKVSHMIVVTKALMNSLGPDPFDGYQLGNILCLDEFHHIYPYVGKAWDGTVEDAAVLLTCILHYSRVAGVSDTVFTARADELNQMKITNAGVAAKPPQLWLIQQYYMPQQVKRRREINRCLAENVKCRYIDRIYLLNEDKFYDQFPDDPKEKIKERVVGKRLTYEMVIRTIYDEVPADTIVVFSNSDIYLEESTRFLWSIDLKDRFLSLLRWDIPDDGSESKIFGPRDDSQDTWVLWSSSVKSRSWKWSDLAFPFGKSGCDNAITTELLRQKFLVANPAYSIKTQHVHASEIRNYDKEDVVDKPVFTYVSPTGLNDMDAREKWESSMILRKISHATFDRQVTSVQDKELATFCSMVKRSNKWPYTRESQNSFTKDANTILKFTNCFLTPNGLPYGHHEIYVGSSQRSQELWSKTAIGGCQPVIQTDLAIAAPLTEKETMSAEAFCVRYMSKIFQLRTGDGDFICPKKRELIDVLQIFRWSTPEVPVLPQDPNTGIYCKEAIVWACGDDDDMVSREDIAALRANMNPPWRISRPKKQKMTVLEDGLMIDGKWVTELEEKLGEDWDVNILWPKRSSLERIHRMMIDTDVFIFANGETLKNGWSWMWLLPEGARVIEIQNEMDPQGDAIHFAGAAGLSHKLVVMRKGLRDYMIRDSVKHTVSTCLGKGSVAAKTNTKPIVWLPRSDITGFYAHAGDSFREMVRIWGERGYCQVNEHPVATNCWWGEVGSGWLLYDRPNLDWIYNAPPVEQSWKYGLFGNPEPPNGGGGFAWSFWPRRPRLVEDIVAAGQTAKSFEERGRGLVFYGRIENRVQERRRARPDEWKAVCSEFFMPNGAGTEYVLSQREYLERLSESRFGLCLAGYGRKCHREVECMAMGCIPVVDKEVDMSSYANPPIEGVHYIRVSGPEDVTKKIDAIDATRWASMSLACKSWWQANASCEGMFALTVALTAAKNLKV